MSTRLKVGLVTGAGSGIGRASALKMAKDGFGTLVLLGRRQSPLDGLADELRALDVQAHVRSVDLAARSSLDQFLKELPTLAPSLDAVVHAAGQSQLTPLDGKAMAAFSQLIEVDLTCALRLLRGVLPSVSDGGRIVLVSSILSRVGIPALHAYCAAKSGLDGLARALALDVATKGITVNTVRPGWVDTDMARDAIRMQAPAMGKSEEEARADFEAEVPMGRFLTAEEVAGTIMWILSPAAAQVTGQAIPLCGGATA